MQIYLHVTHPGRDTRPEMLIHHGLYAGGWRYRLYAAGLPAALVFAARRAVIFVNGGFWHMHDCSLFRMPAMCRDFWKEKLGRNRESDEVNLQTLRPSGWRALVIWKYATKGPHRLGVDKVLTQCERWLSDPIEVFAEIKGSS